MPYAPILSDRMTLKTLIGSTCALLLVAPPTAQKIAFAPADESEVSKTFETRISLDLSDFGVTLNDADPGQLDATVTLRSTERVRVVDTYASSEDGRPTRLDRQFEELSVEAEYEQVVSEEGALGQGTASAKSELVDSTVRFEWEEGGWTKSWVGEESDEELLPALVEDMDLRELLPDGEIEEGDSWSVEPGAFLALFAPGGDLALEFEFERPEGDARFQFIGLDAETGVSLRPYLQELEEQTSGSVTAEFEGSNKVEGRSLARIAIEFALDFEHDSSNLLAERWEQIPMFDEIGLEMGEASTRVEASGQAQLIWDIEAGHASSFELEGDLNLTLETEFEARIDPEVMDVLSSVELSGEIQQIVEFE